MTIKAKVLVDLPSRTVIVPNGKYKYVYYTKKTYRIANGQIRNDRVAIGKLSEDGRLIPNQNYYEIFGESKPVDLPDTVRSCGSYAVCKALSESLGLNSLLIDVFPDTYGEIMATAQYILCNGSVMYYINDWLDGNISFTTKPMDDVTTGRVLKGIKKEDKQRFLSQWLKKHIKDDLVAYDVTSISSYSNKLGNVEYGYNRDKENLPQINFGMYYTEKTRLPIYYNVYPGSINDKSHCKYMIEGSNSLGAKNIYFVIDKGFFTKENLKYITDSGHRYVTTMPPTLNIYQELVDENYDDIIDNIDYKITDRLMYCKKVEITPYGFRMNAHIYYNQAKVLGDKAEIYEKIAACEKDIEEMTTLPNDKSIYYKYFDLEIKDGKLIYSKNKEKIKKALNRCGFFVIAETIFSKASKEILDIYAQRDGIEKTFDDLKNELDVDRLHCSNEEILEGKMFASFLALIYLSQMRLKLKDYMTKKKYTFKKILLELDKIKIIYDARKQEKYRLLNPLTKTQREIVETLGLKEDIFSNLF